MWASVCTIAAKRLCTREPDRTRWARGGLRWSIGFVAAAAIAAMMLPLGWQAHRTSWVAYAERDNPYAYVPTLPDAVKLETDIRELLRVYPGHDRPTIALVWHDPYYWPLPWYLRHADSIGYWTDTERFAASAVERSPAPIVVGSPHCDADVTRVLGETYVMIGYYGIRRNVLALVWVRMDWWEAHLRNLGRL